MKDIEKLEISKKRVERAIAYFQGKDSPAYNLVDKLYEGKQPSENVVKARKRVERGLKACKNQAESSLEDCTVKIGSGSGGKYKKPVMHDGFIPEAFRVFKGQAPYIVDNIQIFGKEIFNEMSAAAIEMYTDCLLTESEMGEKLPDGPIKNEVKQESYMKLYFDADSPNSIDEKKVREAARKNLVVKEAKSVSKFKEFMERTLPEYKGVAEDELEKYANESVKSSQWQRASAIYGALGDEYLSRAAVLFNKHKLTKEEKEERDELLKEMSKPPDTGSLHEVMASILSFKKSGDKTTNANVYEHTELRADSWKTIGKNLAKRKNYDDALACMLKSQNTRRSAETLVEIGDTYYAINKHNKAIYSYEEAIELDKKSIPAWVGAAYTRFEMSKEGTYADWDVNTEEALRCAREAQKLYDDVKKSGKDDNDYKVLDEETSALIKTVSKARDEMVERPAIGAIWKPVVGTTAGAALAYGAGALGGIEVPDGYKIVSALAGMVVGGIAYILGVRQSQKAFENRYIDEINAKSEKFSDEEE